MCFTLSTLSLLKTFLRFFSPASRLVLSHVTSMRHPPLQLAFSSLAGLPPELAAWLGLYLRAPELPVCTEGPD